MVSSDARRPDERPRSEGTNTVGERVKLARQTRLLTQAALAAKAGVSVKTVSRIEQGEDATLTTLQKIADALAIRPLWLARGEGKRDR